MKVGVGRVDFTPRMAGAPAGWSFAGPARVSPSSAPEDRLIAHALAVEAGGETLVIVFADLHSGGAALRAALAREANVPPERLILAGTHTHQGPGRFYGNAYFDSFVAPGRVPVPWPAQARRLGRILATAVRDAIADLADGELALGTALSRGAGSNRAYRAWYRNDPVGRTAADGPETARDRRVTALVVRQGGATRSVLGVQAVHGTALGPQWPMFSADHPGETRVRAEAALGTWVALGCGAAGDVSPLAVGPEGEVLGERPLQGRALAAEVGRAHAAALVEAVRAAEPLRAEIRVASAVWRTRDELDLAPPAPGLATAGGGVDGTSENFAKVGRGVEAPGYDVRRAWPPGHPQHPKVPIQHLLAAGKVLPISALSHAIGPRNLPITAARLGGLVLVTVPGEPTTEAGARIEAEVVAAGGEPARVLGFAQDYAGYWTTPEEYDLQLYEGASTLYGRAASRRLQARLLALVKEL